MATSWSPSQPRPRSTRARPSISCLECRRKKLRCDRVQPCMQCKKSRREALCTFANGVPHGRPGPAINTQPGLEQAASIQARNLEAGVVGWNPNCDHSGTSIPGRLCKRSDRDASDAAPLGCIHVKGARSRYLGLGDRMAMLGHVSVLFHWHTWTYFSVRGGQGLHHEKLHMRWYNNYDARDVYIPKVDHPQVHNPRILLFLVRKTSPRSRDAEVSAS